MSVSAAIRRALIDKYRNTTRDRLERVTKAALELGTKAQCDASHETLVHELHTIKGEAKLMAFSDISNLAHLAEDTIANLPGKDIAVCGHARETLLRTVDQITALLGDAPERAREAAAIIAPPAEPQPLPVDPESPRIAHVLAMPARTPQIRIEVRKLDELTEIAGGIVVSQARFERALDEILMVLREIGDLGVASHLATAVASLREGAFDNRSRVQSLEAQVRELRLLSLSSLFDVYPRAVHDIAREQHKDVRVDVRGADVEIDKHVFEALGEPLLHIIRNAIDHGVELPDERRAAGKPAVATITMSALQRGGWAEIEVRDDGRGIDPALIRRLAVERGLVSAAEAALRSDVQVLSYIFQPGFSTRSTITDISGRGVGLDIVKHSIESLGGSVRVDSARGQGTVFVLRVPISVVLMRAMVVEAGRCLYAVPSDAAAMVMRVDPGLVRRDGDHFTIDVDGERVRLEDLACLLDGDSCDVEPPLGSLVIIVQAQSARLALAVDRLLGEQRIVQRTMDPFCEGLRMFSGTAMLENGGLVVLINVPEVIAACDVALPVRQSGRQVLVVDDSELTRGIVVDILRTAGFAVEQAHDGRHALERLGSLRPDVIVSDIDMPELDGFGFLEQLRRNQAFGTIPVVVFSTRATQGDRDRARELGADAYLIKTQTQDDLLVETVARMIRVGEA